MSNLVSIKSDDELDVAALKKLLARVVKRIHQQPNRVRYTMNGFVIAVGSYVKELTEAALQLNGGPALILVGEVYRNAVNAACPATQREAAAA